MYVFLKPRNGSDYDFGDQFQQHNILKLSTSCRTTLLNIQNDSEKVNMNCCRQLNIFNDTEVLIEAKTNDLFVDYASEKARNGSIQSAKEEKLCNVNSSLYECTIVVKGFKDQMIKGKSIWSL